MCYVGMAEDFGYCEERDDSEKKCINFVNLKV